MSETPSTIRPEAADDGSTGTPGAPPDAVAAMVTADREHHAVVLARERGVSSVTALTNLLFLARHPEMDGRRIATHQPELAQEWIDIRDTVVRPVLDRLAPASERVIPAGAEATVDVPAGHRDVPPLEMPPARRWRQPLESEATPVTDSLTKDTAGKIQSVAESFMQWRILDPRDIGTPHNVVVDVRKGKRFLLHNQTNHHYLYYKEQPPGAINLGFTDDAEPSTAARVIQWEFVNRDGSAVRYGEPVAIRCKDDYLYYGERTFGINLKWSDGPSFQWRLYGGRLGDRVKTRDFLCIWNMHGDQGEPMIWFEREIGGNIGWPSSKTLLQGFLDWSKAAVQKAVVEYFKSQAGGS